MSRMQEQITERLSTTTVAGIDVGKDYLDIFIHPEGVALRVRNDKAAIRSLAGTLTARGVERVALEATSRYHRLAHAMLHEAGLAVCVMLTRRIDLVITDRRMPGFLDGDALAHFIAEEYPEVPVLMMSAEWPAPQRTAAIAEFFPKPVNLRAAVRLIGELLSANAGIVLPSSGWSASASPSVLSPTTTSEPTMQPELYSEISCPHCGHRKVEEMPTDACQFFYECEGCATLLRPKAGHCCVFCSYGSVPCPPIQLESQGGGKACCGC